MHARSINLNKYLVNLNGSVWYKKTGSASFLIFHSTFLQHLIVVSSAFILSFPSFFYGKFESDFP